MSININLVGQRDSSRENAEKLQKLKGLSYVVLFITAFLAILVFAIDYRFSASYVRKQQADLQKELDTYGDVSTKIITRNNKLSELSKILSQRKKYNEKTAAILEPLPSGVSIEGFVIDEAGTTMSITSQTLLPIDEYLNSLMDLVESKKIPGVIIKTLSVDGGTYRAELEIL